MVKHRILILEDELAQRVALKRLYRKEVETGDYDLIFTQTGEEALEIIENDQEKNIDLIISDLKLPTAKIDGWNFVKILANRDINIKTIVITAYGKLEQFTEEERKNIIFFFIKEENEEELSEIALKEIIEQSLFFSEKLTIKSQKVRFNTLLKIIKDLSSKQKLQLVDRILSYMNLKELRKLEKQLPELTTKYIQEAHQRDRIRQWLVEKEKAGEFKLPISINNIDYFSVDVKERSSGIYCEIRWWKDGRLFNVHVPKALSDQLLSLLPSDKLPKET